MRKCLGLIVALGLFMLSGCAFGNIETDKLMSPPKPTGEMAEIVSAIEEVSGNKINFKYPQNGDYRSAIIMQDIDNDGEDEAIAMYQVADEESIMHVAIIDKVNGKYVNSGDFKYKASDVDKVCFGDIDGDGQKKVFVGFSSYNNSGKTIAMCYKGTEYVTQELEETYSDFIVADFDGDNRDELLTLTLSRTDSNAESEDKTSDREANAKLIRCEKDSLSQRFLYKFEVMDKAPMDSNALRYVNTLFGQIDANQRGAVVDSMVSGNVVATEIVYWDNREERLVTPLYNMQTHKSQLFYRESLILSADVNEDGIIEIPSVDSYQYMSYKNEAYIVSWIVYNTKTAQTISVREYINNDPDAYIMGIPDKWVDLEYQGYKILVKYDENSRTMTVAEKIRADSGITAGVDLMAIQVVNMDDWNNMDEKSEYLVLEETPDGVYVAKVLNSENPLSIDVKEIEQLFSMR